METALPVAKFVGIYQQLDKSNLHLLNDIYSEQIKFKDPMHEIHGLSELIFLIYIVMLSIVSLILVTPTSVMIKHFCIGLCITPTQNWLLAKLYR